MIDAAVVGATGYTGQELLKLLFRRKDVRVTAVTSESSAGVPLAQFAPALAHRGGLVLEKCDPARIAEKAGVVFLCLPHGEAMNSAGAFLDKGLKVLDLSADFRLRDPELYKKWYSMEHSAQGLLGRAVYGLPEIYGDRISKADFVAVPGCYPTSVILAMAPLVNHPGLSAEVITVNSASGVSGAGRKLKDDYMFAELEGDFYAYGAPNHRHTCEMEQELSAAAGRNIRVSFIPHLLPVTRGIYTTITLPALEGVSGKDIEGALRGRYKDSRFVSVVSGFPRMKWAVNSNRAVIGATVDKRTGLAIIACAIDNLVKGASGQAMQCFNLMHGLDEALGLE